MIAKYISLAMKNIEALDRFVLKGDIHRYVSSHEGNQKAGNTIICSIKEFDFLKI